MMELIDHKIEDLGMCCIDVYRASGDLYDSYDIVPVNEDGTIPRFPDARYGVNQPEYPTYDEDHLPEVMRLFRIELRWDNNGWTETELEIRRDDAKTGKLLVSRKI